MEPKKILMVGRDNPEILKTIQENKQELLESGIAAEELEKLIVQCSSDVHEDWPDPIPFKRLTEDMKENFHVKKFVERWTPGQGAPMKHRKKRAR